MKLQKQRSGANRPGHPNQRSQKTQVVGAKRDIVEHLDAAATGGFAGYFFVFVYFGGDLGCGFGRRIQTSRFKFETGFQCVFQGLSGAKVHGDLLLSVRR